MRILLLIILFSICGTKTIVSQIGGFHHDYMDTTIFITFAGISARQKSHIK